MNRRFFALVFLLVFCAIFAQDEMYSNGVFEFQENKPQKIFTDWSRIRQQPNVKSQILDSLRTNQPVLILKKEEARFSIGHRVANWYKISYQKEDRQYEGYVWGGNLCVGYRNKNGFDFLFGITKTGSKFDKESNQTYETNIATIKVLENNELITESSFETGIGESLSFGEFKIESNHLLKNVDFTLRAGVSGEACGIAGYTNYFLFSNRKLIALPQLMNVGDADVFYHSEEFVFPNDKGGKPSTILFKMEEMEKDEKEKEHFKRSKATYLWSGEKITKQ